MILIAYDGQKNGSVYDTRLRKCIEHIRAQKEEGSDMKKQMLHPIDVTASGYSVQGRPFYPYSGEFHYFRVPKKDWRRRMRLFKTAGGNCLATYIPWLIHEPEEGHFVFGGRSGTHDLEGFLDTAAEEGLYVVARPGPYQYSELKHAGLPGWLCMSYPDLHALDINGKQWNPDAMSYLHPEFLKKVRNWFDEVCPRIARYTVQNGGPVVMAQFDNEVGGIQYWSGSLDYNKTTMGFGKAAGRFPRFLAARYGTIARLNELYGTTYASFAAVKPLDHKTTGDLKEVRQLRDYFQFYVSHLSEYCGVLIEMMLERGIDVPFVHNSGGEQTNMAFKDLAKKMKGRMFLGADHYYNLGQDNWAQNNPTPQHAVKMFCSLEMLRMMGFPPTVWELPGGSMSDWPPITSTDAKASYFMNLALGMKGSNYYILTGGPNIPGTGITADIYDYGSSIGPNNEIRPLFYGQKDFGLFVKRNQWLETAERECDVRVAFDEEFPMAYKFWSDRGGLALTPAETWAFTQKGILTTAFCAGLSPVLMDLDGDEWLGDVKTPVIVPASSVMARARQEQIVRFIKKGGQVLLTPVVPTLDENFEPCTVLVDFAGGISLMPPAKRGLVRLTIGGVVNIWNNGEARFFDKLGKGAKILGIDETSGKPVAAEWTFKGGGKLIVLGFRWSHGMREHERMLVSLLKNLGIRKILSCSNQNVWTSLRTSGNRSVLFLMNLMSAPMETEVVCRPAWSRANVNIGKHALPAMMVKAIELKKPMK